MVERFGGDTVVALSTSDDNVPYVRFVNAHYEHGAFYVITYALSEKMKQIEHNPIVAIAAEWFTAHAVAENLGWFRKKGNHAIAEELKIAFSEWIDNGHNNFDDPNTIILCIRLTDGILLSHGTRYDLHPVDDHQ
jgi:general stress protein 26